MTGDWMSISGSRRAAITAAVLGATMLLTAACTSRSSGGGGGSTTPSVSASTDAAVLGTPHAATGAPIKIGFIDDGATTGIDNTTYFTVAKAAADYANAYLNGINGHPIDLDLCETNYTPSGGTACGVQMVKDKVAILLLPSISVDQYVAQAMAGSNIPIMATNTSQASILSSSTGFVIWNPWGAIGDQIALSKQMGYKKGALVIIDVAAAAQVGAITKPIYAAGGVSEDFVQIAASVADQTGRLQQAIDNGDKSFTIVGSTTFIAASLKALKQLQFKGPVLVALPTLPQAIVSAVPGGVAGIVGIGNYTTNPADPDVKIYNAAIAKYASGANLGAFGPQAGYALVLTLQRALQGHASATDPASITSTLNSMKSPVKLPLGGGATFQCGQKFVSFTPSVCTTGFVRTVLKADGSAASYAVASSAKQVH